MQQKSYPSAELKRHPDLTITMASQGCTDRLASYSTDEQMVSDITQAFRTMKDLDLLSSPSGEWKWIFDTMHSEYRTALASSDYDKLLPLLQNFFRNETSFGLVSQSTFQALTEGGEIALLDFANAILLDIDTWLEFCDSPPLTSLGIPVVGNPYGIMVEDTLVIPDVCRHSYHARKLAALMSYCGDKPTILEIGGGYGGVFWQLYNNNRESGRFCYINCDLGETLLVFYYFVMTSAEHHGPAGGPKLLLKWAVDGMITKEDTEKYDLILVPASQHQSISCGIDIAYNANSFAEMGREDLDAYFQTINRNNPSFIFHQNSNFFPWRESGRGHIETLSKDFPIDHVNLHELYRAIVPWMGGLGRHREYLYVRKGTRLI